MPSRIYGTEGLLEGEGTVGVEPGGVLQATYSGETRAHELPLVDHYRLELEAFARAVANGEPFAAPGEDGVRSVAVISAIAESAATGRTVQVADCLSWPAGPRSSRAEAAISAGPSHACSRARERGSRWPTSATQSASNGLPASCARAAPTCSRSPPT